MDLLQNTSRKRMIMTVFIIIFFQLCVSTYFMAAHKNGFYADDMYSYGFANSDEQLTPLQGKNESFIRYNAWHDGQELIDYLTVSEDEIFSYGKIVHVLEKDAHPPLFYFLLHLICSLTPNVFSKWSGYVINVVGFILLQVFLYRLTLFISKSRSIALLTMTMFGFSSAAISMMALLRMYMLGTGLALSLTFYGFRYLEKTDAKKPADKNLFLCFVSLYLASLTVYIDVIYAFLFTLCICIMMIAKKELKKMLCFGFSMMFAVGLMVLSFPTFIIQMKEDQPALQGASGYPLALQLRMGIHVMSNAVFGINTPIFPSMIPFYIFWSLVFILTVYLILLFLFRKDTWFLAFRSKAKDFLTGSFRRSLPYLYYLIPVFLCTTVMLFYYATQLKLYYYRYDGMRYLFLLTPFYSVCIFTVLFKMIKPNIIRTIIVILLVSTSILFGQRAFLEEYFETKALSEITAGSDVVVVEEQAITFMFHIADILKCDRFYYTNPRSFYVDIPRTRLGELEPRDNDMYLLLDMGAESIKPEKMISIALDGSQTPDVNPYNDVYYYFKSIPEYSNIEYVGDFATCYLYKLK